MQKFANNWFMPVVLALGADTLDVALADGSYQITLSDSLGPAATRWEIVGAEVVAGVAALWRGLEGTVDQDWPDGSVAYISITAGFLEHIQQAAAATSSYVEVSAPGATIITASTAVIELFSVSPVSEQDFILDLPPPAVGRAHVYDVISTVAGVGNRLVFRSGVGGFDWAGFVGEVPAGVESGDGELSIPMGNNYTLRAMFVASAVATERYLNVAVVSTTTFG